MIVFLASGAFALVVMLGIATLTFGVPNFASRRTKNEFEIVAAPSRIRWGRVLIAIAAVIAVAVGIYIVVKPYVDPVTSLAGNYSNPTSALGLTSGTNNTDQLSSTDSSTALNAATSALGGPTSSSSDASSQLGASSANGASLASVLGATNVASGSQSKHGASLTSLVYGLGGLLIVTSVVKRIFWGLVIFKALKPSNLRNKWQRFAGWFVKTEPLNKAQAQP